VAVLVKAAHDVELTSPTLGSMFTFDAEWRSPVGSTPEQFGDYLKKDIDRWAKLAKTTNI
jgi:tripartite-type tricarboxylate transporter receptor subunit TctC